MALCESDPFSNQSVEMWSLHMRKAQLCNRVESLLIRNDKDHIGPLIIFFFVLNEHVNPALALSTMLSCSLRFNL